MRLGVVSDVHGNLAALEAVIADGDALGIDGWWALGDLVLFGPRPVEVIETLRGLPDVAFVSGNTDRYVVTGGQPPVHPTLDAIAGDADLTARYVSVAAGVAWAQGALTHAGLLDWLAALPSEQRIDLPDGSTLLGVHASPGNDDGAGINPDDDDGVIEALLTGCDADIVVGGHTHVATDRMVGAVRALNPGSAGMPRRCVGASWMMIDAEASGVRVEHRTAPFDVEAVARDLHARRHPNAAFVASVIRREHAFSR